MRMPSISDHDLGGDKAHIIFSHHRAISRQIDEPRLIWKLRYGHWRLKGRWLELLDSVAYSREPGLTPYCRWCKRCPCGHRPNCPVNLLGREIA